MLVEAASGLLVGAEVLVCVVSGLLLGVDVVVSGLLVGAKVLTEMVSGLLIGARFPVEIVSGLISGVGVLTNPTARVERLKVEMAQDGAQKNADRQTGVRKYRIQIQEKISLLCARKRKHASGCN